MARSRGGLGRGLESLFEDAAPSLESDSGVRTLPLRRSSRTPPSPQDFQPGESGRAGRQHRGAWAAAAHRGAAPAQRGYRIVAGERRWRACRIAGLTEVPVIVRDVTDQEAMELALVENLQREDLDPVEEACGIRELMDRCGLTQEQAARRLGKSRSALANSLRLLGLPPQALALLKAGKLTAGHARRSWACHRSAAGAGRPADRGQWPERPPGRGPVPQAGPGCKAGGRTRAAAPARPARGGGGEPAPGAGQ